MWRRLLRDARGAVYVEFLIAFLPVLITFLCILQLALLFTVKLYVDHAAVQGARTAAVVFGDDPAHYNGAPVHQIVKTRSDDVRRAVVLTLAPLILDGTVHKIDVSYPLPNDPNGGDRLTGRPLQPMNDTGTTMVRVSVDVLAKCKIAFADRIACGGLFGLGDQPLTAATGYGVSKRIRGTALFPYQGASYPYRR